MAGKWSDAASAIWAKTAWADSSPPSSQRSFKFSNVDFGKFEYESKTLSSLPSAGITANGIFFLIDTLFK